MGESNLTAELDSEPTLNRLAGEFARTLAAARAWPLVEQYTCGGLSVVHLDLYRLRGGGELENLGLRDWLAEPQRWIAVEWPERAPELAERCDLALEFAIPASGGRRVTVVGRTRLGIEALRSVRQKGFNNET